MAIKSFQNLTSFGSATLGQRGQIVIPVEIRKKLKIKKGEKFIVFFAHTSKAIVFIPAHHFGKIISEFDKKISKFKKLIK